MSKVKNVLIMGAAGRDFHNFNTYFRKNRDARGCCILLHTRFPGLPAEPIPPDLSGELYPEGNPDF